MNGLKALFSLVLFFIAFFMGGMILSLILASFRPPLVILIVVGLALIIIPFAIGWLTPSQWWIGFSGAIIPLYFGITELLYMQISTLQEFLVRLPLYLPLPVSLFFAFLGKFLRQKRLASRGLASRGLDKGV